MRRTKHLTSRRRVTSLALGCAVTVAFGGALIAAAPAYALPPECTQPGGSTQVTCTYADPSSTPTFAVPDGVTSVHVVAIGGKGGSAPTADGTGVVPGGFGARVEGNIAVTPGQTLYLAIGWDGRDSPQLTSGGGASDIRTDPTDLTSRLVVAGGGGGAGGEVYNSLTRSDGGAGGNAGAVPQPGQPGHDVSSAIGTATGGSPGQPGSATAGGAGGAGGTSTAGIDGCSGEAGVLWAGGHGSRIGAPCLISGAGDGGYGLYGGGGGGSGTTAEVLTDPSDPNSFVGVESGGGGGGAGSSLAPPAGTITTDNTAVPEIVISYVLGADVSTSIAAPATATPGTKLTYVITVANAGPLTANGAVLNAAIPARSSFVRVSTGAGSCTAPPADASSGTIACHLGDLPAFGSATVRVVLSVGGPKGSVVTFSASAASTVVDPKPANNAATANTKIVKK
jgi:uncharacterized repeat protein (TIGR01451 family)